MPISSSRHFLALFFVSFLALTARPALVLSADNIDQVISSISRAERKLLNLQVSAVSTAEERGSDGQWVETPQRTELTAWFNGMIAGPERLEVKRTKQEIIIKKGLVASSDRFRKQCPDYS